MSTQYHKIKSGDYTIIHKDRNQEIFDIARAEKAFKAKYVGEFSIKGKTDWVNFPVSIFYTKKPHPKGSNYLGIYTKDGALSVTDGISATDHTWIGVLDEETKTILYSAYRHDYQTYKDLTADGGAEYTIGSMHSAVSFQIEDGKIKYIERL